MPSTQCWLLLFLLYLWFQMPEAHGRKTTSCNKLFFLFVVLFCFGFSLKTGPTYFHFLTLLPINVLFLKQEEHSFDVPEIMMLTEAQQQFGILMLTFHKAEAMLPSKPPSWTRHVSC